MRPIGSGIAFGQGIHFTDVLGCDLFDLRFYLSGALIQDFSLRVAFWEFRGIGLDLAQLVIERFCFRFAVDQIAPVLLTIEILEAAFPPGDIGQRRTESVKP